MSAQELSHTINSLISDHDEIATALATALVITGDAAFRNQLRSLAGGAKGFSLGPLGAGAWLVLDGPAFSIHRGRPLDVISGNGPSKQALTIETHHMQWSPGSELGWRRHRRL